MPIGLTGCIPPFACKVYDLPSVPVTITLVALVAVTVNMDEPPEVIDAGLAVIVMVGCDGADPTVIVVAAVVLPPGPVAVAVYVVVAVGLTDFVPPLACRVYDVPSFPANVTCVASAAVTVNVEEAPDVIDVELAVMLTVCAAGGAPGMLFLQPVNSRSRGKQDNSTSGEMRPKKPRTRMIAFAPGSRNERSCDKRNQDLDTKFIK